MMTGRCYLSDFVTNADDVEREALATMRSTLFYPPARGRIAVKIVTGMEMTHSAHVA